MKSKLLKIDLVLQVLFKIDRYVKLQKDDFRYDF